MQKLNLPQVTLLGADTKDAGRLMKAFGICEAYADFGAKKLLTSGDRERETASGIEIINIEGVKSLKDYSGFMVKRLNDFVATPFVLVIQFDGFILNPQAWTDEFLNYDYIGAPWRYSDGKNVGNGGFSLRSKKLLEILQKDEKIKKLHPEDHRICRTYGDYLKQKGVKFAPESLAAKFSIEGGRRMPFKPVKYGSVWDGQFGFHGLDKTDISKWRRPLVV